MSYQEVLEKFWKEVEASVEANTFAKLTMAKTIGKLELRNIFIRPTVVEDQYKFAVKWHYRQREKEDVGDVKTLLEAKDIIQKHLQNPFYSMVLFTIEKDVIFKINKKGAGSIVENPPTFSDVVYDDDHSL